MGIGVIPDRSLEGISHFFKFRILIISVLYNTEMISGFCYTELINSIVINIVIDTLRKSNK